MNRTQKETTDMTASETPTAAAPDLRSRWIALFVLCVGVLMIVLDATVVNVALPSIQERPRLLAGRASPGSSTPT